MNILAIADDRNMLGSYRFLLRGQGHSLVAVENREHALADLRARHVDLVLLDQNLRGGTGGADGLALIDVIRTYSPGATIFIVSGAQYLEIKKSFALGVDDYLIKNEHLQPLLLAKISLVDRLLQARRQAMQSSAEREDAIRATWRDLQDEQDAGRKGRLLEDLMVDLFKSIPGVREAIPRVRNDVEELDVVVRTDGTGIWSPFQTTPHVLVECKKWSEAVGRAELDTFDKKIERRGVMSRLGLFIAWNGVSGPFARTAAEIRARLIVVIDRERLAALVATIERAHLLQGWIDEAGDGRPA